ncbi:uncharacterized protein LOC110350811 [Heterocephalus glaber]|uniref:Uncharacterized protein LOC110350811 n=1 Tax=Heterocephalus glaber TaxID=10181 RepID=A0AAX6TEG5_HETGA|nr:uncharacterized protein LOC110350811 [Heterocephalus glaber]
MVEDSGLQSFLALWNYPGVLYATLRARPVNPDTRGGEGPEIGSQSPSSGSSVQPGVSIRAGHTDVPCCATDATHGAVASASPGNLLEMQTTRPTEAWGITYLRVVALRDYLFQELHLLIDQQLGALLTSRVSCCPDFAWPQKGSFLHGSLVWEDSDSTEQIPLLIRRGALPFISDGRLHSEIPVSMGAKSQDEGQETDSSQRSLSCHQVGRQQEEECLLFVGWSPLDDHLRPWASTSHHAPWESLP